MDAAEKIAALEASVSTLQSSIDRLTGIYDAYLSWAALIVAVLTLFIVIYVTGGAFYIKWKAEKVAKKAADRIAEREANKYMQSHLPEIIGSYRDMVSGDGSSDRYQEDEDNDGEHL